VGLVVINIANGPGTDLIPDYQPAIAAARAAGIAVVGYVDAGNGRRSHSDVVADIDQYTDWYAPSGFLFDQAHLADGDVRTYFLPLRDRVKADDPNALVILNPGTSADECIMEIADIVVDFEGSCASYLAPTTAMPRWRHEYRPERFWHIVYDVPAASVQLVVDAAKARRTGWLYTTDQPIDDTSPGGYLYDRLPDAATLNQLEEVLTRRS
jgi:Spherulation-specific family 4